MNCFTIKKIKGNRFDINFLMDIFLVTILKLSVIYGIRFSQREIT